MTSAEIRTMQAEDDELSRMMGKGPEMGFVPNWRLIVQQPVEQVPVVYEAPEMDPPEDLTAEPLVSYDCPVRLQQAISNAVLPLAIAVFAWSMHMSGDASAWLSTAVGLPALAAALIGAVAPWGGKLWRRR